MFSEATVCWKQCWNDEWKTAQSPGSFQLSNMAHRLRENHPRISYLIWSLLSIWSKFFNLEVGNGVNETQKDKGLYQGHMAMEARERG
jgi:hypothetical protein